MAEATVSAAWCTCSPGRPRSTTCTASPRPRVPGCGCRQRFAAALHVGPGATITTVDGARVRVAGLYRDLAPDPFRLADLPRYFCSWTDAIVATVAPATAPSPRPRSPNARAPC